jgi:hypothetical protein
MPTNDDVFIFSFELISNNFRNREEKKKQNNVTHIFTILFIKLTMSKMVGSKVFQILQGIDIAEYYAHFNIMFG